MPVCVCVHARTRERQRERERKRKGGRDHHGTARFSGNSSLMGFFVLGIGVVFLQFEALTHSLLLVFHTRLLTQLHRWKQSYFGPVPV